MKWYLKVILDNYANFNGRARRKAYWIFFFFNLLITYVIAHIASILVELTDVLYLMFLPIIYLIAVAVPTIAVGVRRMHDLGKPGWILFIPIYSFVLAVSSGEVGTNKYGEDPKHETQETIKDYINDIFALREQQT
ncbi:DUF805 domain-containing protein [Aestuariibaculum sediminum]|uniref:DUF805 domain-containing protein n=1 Tax=Aestuariibaculum sediminum TaxID=2770637 RepID=A0A8J6U692_9FLAO|nr:DUF805 domain-containing protein [Aestuariibaculum sediminum]MBD0830595.1 DUF805 domain-containing protein [Aestuariibaculum sediminum]